MDDDSRRKFDAPPELSAALTAVELIRVYNCDEEIDVTYSNALQLLDAWLITRPKPRSHLMMLLQQISRHSAANALKTYGSVYSAQRNLRGFSTAMNEHCPEPTALKLARLYVREGTETDQQAASSRIIRNEFFKSCVDAYIRPSSQIADAFTLTLCAANVASHLLVQASGGDHDAAETHLTHHADTLYQLAAPDAAKNVPDDPGGLV